MFSRFSEKLRELGIRVEQMGMLVETAGGIRVVMDGREFEISIGEAADFVDGIIKPVDFIKRIGA